MPGMNTKKRKPAEPINPRPGRPPAAGTQRQVRISVTVPPEYRDWLQARGEVAAQIRAMIEREMEANHEAR